MEFRIRSATANDLDPIADLANREATVRLGSPRFAADDIREEWGTPGFSLEADTRVALGADGTVAAYMEYWNVRAPYVNPFLWWTVDPAWSDDAMPTALLAWGIGRAREDIGRAPDDASVHLDLKGVVAADAAGRRRAEAARFAEVRRFYVMELALDPDRPLCRPAGDRGGEMGDHPAQGAPRAAGVLPSRYPAPRGYVIRPFLRERAEEAYRVVFDAFQDHFGIARNRDFAESYTQWRHVHVDSARVDPGLHLVAQRSDGGVIVGAAVNQPHDGPDESTGFVNALAVAREHRGRGIAEALLRATADRFAAVGKRRLALGVDAENLTGALHLYEKLGMTRWAVCLRFSQEIRPGVDYLTR